MSKLNGLLLSLLCLLVGLNVGARLPDPARELGAKCPAGCCKCEARCCGGK